MIEFLTDKITALVSDFVSEQEGKIKGFINKKIEEKSIEKRFKEFSQRFFDEKIENSLRIEEINFPALNEYVRKNLLTQVRDSLLKDKWGSFSDSCFLYSCINLAKADTPEKERIVCAYVRTVREIVKSFYIDKNSIELQMLLGEHFSDLIEYEKNRHAELVTFFNKIYRDIAYINSFASVIDGISPKTLILNPFHYRNDIITFRGREEEQKEVYNFLDDERKLLWMAITGDGGSGKSKLMYHMTKKLESHDCWKVIWLGKESLKSIMTKDKFEYPINLLFVCDYGGQFAEKLGDFIERLCTFNGTFNEKIRLVILEREGFVQDCEEFLKPMWYRSFRGNISRNHYIDSTAFDKNKSLKLKSLNDSDFKGIVKDYLIKEKSLSDEEIDKIINTIIVKAHEIDNRETGTRPLTLLFIADAVADGKEAKNWDLNKLVEHFIERYKYYWKLIIGEKNDDLFKAVEEITAYATAVGGWDLRNKEIGEPIKSAIDLFLKKVDDKNLFLRSICEKDKSDGIWSPFEPDLIGEFFVLEFLRNKIENYDEDYVSEFSKLCWTKGENFWWFLYRCSQNYRKRKKFKKIFANGMEIFEPKDEENAEWYSYLLEDMTNIQKIEIAIEAAEKLESISEKYPYNEDIKILFSKGLVNLMYQDYDYLIYDTFIKIRDLAEKNPDNESIQSDYATGLAKLSYVEENFELYDILDEVERLTVKYPNNESIESDYVTVLANLSEIEDCFCACEIVTEIYELMKKYPKNENIKSDYAISLANLSGKQIYSEAKDTVEKIREMADNYSENIIIQNAYARGLVNLIDEQDYFEIKDTISKLKGLVEKYPDNKIIYWQYERGVKALKNIEKI